MNEETLSCDVHNPPRMPDVTPEQLEAMYTRTRWRCEAVGATGHVCGAWNWRIRMMCHKCGRKQP